MRTREEKNIAACLPTNPHPPALPHASSEGRKAQPGSCLATEPCDSPLWLNVCTKGAAVVR